MKAVALSIPGIHFTGLVKSEKMWIYYDGIGGRHGLLQKCGLNPSIKEAAALQGDQLITAVFFRKSFQTAM